MLRNLLVATVELADSISPGHEYKLPTFLNLKAFDMTLLQKLQASGVKVYSGTPLWEKVETLDTVQVSDNCVVTKSEKFNNYQLVIETPEGRVYIPLKHSARADQDSYELVKFTATRDWEDYNIPAGEVRVFAI